MAMTLDEAFAAVNYAAEVLSEYSPAGIISPAARNLDKAAATFRSHLTQPAQAVDVVAWRWRDDVRPGLPWRTTTDADVIKQMQASGGYEIEPLTRAIHQPHPKEKNHEP